MTNQPEALRLADALDKKSLDYPTLEMQIEYASASELRRLHEVNQELVEALRQLACLGNGNKYGNSDGNLIARAALAKATGESNV